MLAALPIEEMLLFGVAFVSGLVDSIVGGGGLLALPALLLYGASPIEALATTKLQNIPGKISAIIRYALAGHLSIRRLGDERFWLSLALCFIAGAIGAFAATRLSSEFLGKIIPLVLIASATYFAFSARVRGKKNKPKTRLWRGKTFTFGFLPPIAFYDGFFGPGAGTFFIVGLTLLRGLKMLIAIAYSRALNLASNLGALLLFAFGAGFLWKACVIMAPAQVLGAVVGSHIAMRVPQRPLRLLVASLTSLIAILLFARSVS